MSSVSPASEDDIARLVRHLDHDDFRVREAASRDLIQLGDRVIPAVTKATKSSSPEVRSRASRILSSLRRMGAIQNVFNDAHLSYVNPKAKPSSDRPMTNLLFTERPQGLWKVTETKQGYSIQANEGTFRGWYLEFDANGRAFRHDSFRCAKNLQLSKEPTRRAHWRLTKTENGYLIQARVGRFENWYLDIDAEGDQILLTSQLVEGAYWRINRIERARQNGESSKSPTP